MDEIEVRGEHGYFIEGNPGGPGRPLKFETPKELEQAIFGPDGYFEHCDQTLLRVGTTSKGEAMEVKVPATYGGLSEWLGVDVKTIRNYSSRDGFLPVLTRARNAIEARVEEGLLVVNNPRGHEFWLRNRGQDWHDTKEIINSGNQPNDPNIIVIDVSKFDRLTRMQVHFMGTLMHVIEEKPVSIEDLRLLEIMDSTALED
jgi:hypothetical protein